MPREAPGTRARLAGRAATAGGDGRGDCDPPSRVPPSLPPRSVTARPRRRPRSVCQGCMRQGRVTQARKNKSNACAAPSCSNVQDTLTERSHCNEESRTSVLGFFVLKVVELELHSRSEVRLLTAKHCEDGTSLDITAREVTRSLVTEVGIDVPLRLDSRIYLRGRRDSPSAEQPRHAARTAPANRASSRHVSSIQATRRDDAQGGAVSHRASTNQAPAGADVLRTASEPQKHAKRAHSPRHLVHVGGLSQWVRCT